MLIYDDASLSRPISLVLASVNALLLERDPLDDSMWLTGRHVRVHVRA